MQLRKIAIYTLIILITTLLLLSRTAYAWDPETRDLKGTDSSTNYDVEGENRRFDIYTTPSLINGIQVGEDDESIAFLIKLAPLDRSWNGFKVRGMKPNDQYEVQFNFPASSKSFSILFWASGSSAGKCRLYYKDESWVPSEDFFVKGIVSGTHYRSLSGNIGFTLRDASPYLYGFVKLVVSKEHLYNLGARGNIVTGIFAIALAGGNGEPGGGVDTPNDRCPAEGYASWELKGDIPDLPMGVLLLALPIIAIYAYLKRSKSGAVYGLKIRS